MTKGHDDDQHLAGRKKGEENKECGAESPFKGNSEAYKNSPQ
jgi:hypothetical protein